MFFFLYEVVEIEFFLDRTFQKEGTAFVLMCKTEYGTIKYQQSKQ